LHRPLVVGVTRAGNFIYRLGLWEIVLIVASFFFYSVVRQLSSGRLSDAFSNGFDVVRLERTLGIMREAQLQELVLSSEAVTKFFNAVYVYGHLPLVVAAGLWLFFVHRPRYPAFRNALLLSGALGLVIFNVFPLAPPRLMPWPYGLVDTLSVLSRVNYHSAGNFVNPYAAMPSMHVAWNLVAALALLGAAQNLPARLLAIVSPVLMSVAVVVTGNHFILDVAVGLLVGGLSVALALVYGEQWRRISQSFTRTPGATASA
jgi:membrane-associated phospholipid phosphatase